MQTSRQHEFYRILKLVGLSHSLADREKVAKYLHKSKDGINRWFMDQSKKESRQPSESDLKLLKFYPTEPNEKEID